MLSIVGLMLLAVAVILIFFLIVIFIAFIVDLGLNEPQALLSIIGIILIWKNQEISIKIKGEKLYER